MSSNTLSSKNPYFEFYHNLSFTAFSSLSTNSSTECNLSLGVIVCLLSLLTEITCLYIDVESTVVFMFLIFSKYKDNKTIWNNENNYSIFLYCNGVVFVTLEKALMKYDEITK